MLTFRTLLALCLAALPALGCDSPTGPSRNLDDLLSLRPVELRIAFVPRHLPPGHWLTTQDTIVGRITLQLGPEYRGAVPRPGGVMTGAARYEGVPPWTRAERESGLYEGQFSGTVDPGSSILIVFSEWRPDSGEFFTLALRPAQGLPSWTAQWYEAGKAIVFVTGDALLEP